MIDEANQMMPWRKSEQYRESVTRLISFLAQARSEHFAFIYVYFSWRSSRVS